MATSPQPQKNGKNKRHLLILCINTLLFFIVYRVLISYGEQSQQTFYSFVCMVLYLALLLGFTLAYLIYNRFFYRNGITHEQLPEDWSAEKKIAFLEDAKNRQNRSKWMLTIIFPLVVTFLIDAVDLFIIDTFLRM
ncbi:MAG: hypothetical protein IJC95_04090 [Clostridia bacterium]|nr:hypothetical protein [Oscillospiraceae bacterium]MBQ3056648.1 hypothetical protein [Clostridia bacterium]